MSGPGVLVLGIALGIGFYALKRLQAGADATRVIDSATGENNATLVPLPGKSAWVNGNETEGTNTGAYAEYMSNLRNTTDPLPAVKNRAQKKHEAYVGGPRRHKIPTVPTQSTPFAGLVNNHD